MKKKVKVLVVLSCPTLCDPWTVARQVPLSMEFSRQEYIYTWLKKVYFLPKVRYAYKRIIVQLLSRVWLFATLWTAARQAFLSFTISLSLLKLMSTESVMPSNHLILCRPLLFLPSVFPSIILHTDWIIYYISFCTLFFFHLIIYFGHISISPSVDFPYCFEGLSVLLHWFSIIYSDSPCCYLGWFRFFVVRNRSNASVGIHIYLYDL